MNAAFLQILSGIGGISAIEIEEGISMILSRQKL